MRDFSQMISDLDRRVKEASIYLKVDEAKSSLQSLETQAADPKLWDDQDKAREITTLLSSCKADIDTLENLQEKVSDITTLSELAREVQDETLEPEIDTLCESLSKELDQLELRSLFTGENDERDAICSINSGAGGELKPAIGQICFFECTQDGANVMIIRL